MAVNYDIKADIVDIRFDKPKHLDTFFVDTNVWYWLTYSQASVNARTYQVNDYPNYVKKIRGVNAQLLRCNLSLAELAHIIEDTEFRIFCNNRGWDPSVYPKKEFRHNFALERANVVKEIESAWTQVQQFSNAFSITIDDGAANTFITDLKTDKLDGYDFFSLSVLRRNGVPILTDDGDFATVPGITVFTANLGVIDEARKCGKLIMR